MSGNTSEAMPQQESESSRSGEEMKASPSQYATRSTTLASRASDEFAYFPSSEDNLMDEAAAMILSRIDKRSYKRAVLLDSDRIMKRNLLPKSFPWHRPPAPILRTVPRDIEDMTGVLHAGIEDEKTAPFDLGQGPHGFGLFNQGGKQGNESKSENQGIPRDKISAAARRSCDPGVIDFNVKVPPPSSLDTVLVGCQDQGIIPFDPMMKYSKKWIEKARAYVNAERADIASTMPLYWKALDGQSFFNPPGFVQNEVVDSESDDESTSEGELLYRRVEETTRERNKYIELAKSCVRNWRVSVKVGGVSSRVSLHKNNPEQKTSGQKAPMYTFATLPSSVQTGTPVSVETAIEMDKDALLHQLGSYDCRGSTNNVALSFQGMENISSKTKKINVGRNRLIWSRIRNGNGSKSSYDSLLTGQKLEQGAAKVCLKKSSSRVLLKIPSHNTIIKRPRDIQVYIRVNGKLVTIEAGSSPKNNHIGLKGVEIVNWKESAIENAVGAACLDFEVNDIIISSPKTLKRKARCTLDSLSWLDTLAKRAKFAGSNGKKAHVLNDAKANEQITQMKYGGSKILRHSAPNLISLPLEDGFVRVICDLHGSMVGSSVHDLLNKASRNHMANQLSCSVCWRGSEVAKVLECNDCGLTVHHDCCHDKGVFINEIKSNDGGIIGRKLWRCPICAKSVSHIQSENDETALQAGSRKSQRTPRLPSRFTEGDLEIDLIEPSQQNKKVLNLRPSPKCTLCPHAGGAMSESALKGDNAKTQRWTHEICRLWCRRDNLTSSRLKCERIPDGPSASYEREFPRPTTPVCSLCGMGKIHNEGTENEEKIQDADGMIPGLIRCAAVGCSVWFHPMCAVLSSKLTMKSQSQPPKKGQNEEIEDALRTDRDLSKEYSLKTTEVRKQGKSFAIHIGFCGLHHQNREASFYGCSPETISPFMKIPNQ